MERTRLGELCWVDLSARDLEAQSQFYERLFGWTHLDVPTETGSPYRMFQMDGVTVAGASQMTPEMEASGAVGGWNVHFAAPDVDSVAERATALGGEVVAPPADAMRWGRIAGVKDPTGGMFFLWQKGEHPGARRFGEPGTLLWADFSTPDPERAAAFFRDLLGWDVTRAEQSETPYWIVNVHGTPQAGIMPLGPQTSPSMPPSWLTYFGVADATAAADVARTLGARVDVEPRDVGITVFAVMSDPAGAVLGVMTPTAGM